jgi:hypothetical protein
LCYYAVASWPIIPAERNFFGPHPGACDALGLWVVAAALLALPWLLVWSSDRHQFLWRAPVGILLTVIPPLGVIGWASPLTAAGFLFPGTSWIGVIALTFATGLLASSPGFALLAISVPAIILNICSGPPPRLSDWEGINTRFGGISHQPTGSVVEFSAVQAIQRRALVSKARVVVFPETVVPAWNAATDAFWSHTVAALRLAGKTIVVGSKISESSQNAFSPEDLAASVATLISAQPPTAFAFVQPGNTRPSFRNVLIVRGREESVFDQRIPVPIGMWRPFGDGGVPLRLNGGAVLPIVGRRAAVLICYEQLLTWPILTSMLGKPTVIVAVANDYWARGTTIPAFQLTAVRAWARLMALPYVSATNI